MATRGFTGRRRGSAFARRLPPGQFETDDFPVLAKGPTPRIDLATWRFTLSDGPRPLAGVAPPSAWLLALSFDDYDTNVPAADLLGGQAMIATHFDGKPLAAEHGGPARLLVPHLYFWKSAKWLKGLKFTARDEAGFWELRGYHMYGDPWRQQRYSDDP